MTVNGIGNAVTREIAKLQPALLDALTISGYTSYYEGRAEPFKLLPALTGQKTPGFVQQALGVLQELVSREAADQVDMPVLKAVLKTVGDSVALQGANYRVTGELVKRGAFAATAHLTEQGIYQVRDSVQEALREGWGTKQFIDDLKVKLSSEASPLSEHHLETIFRTNVLSYISKGKFDSVQTPIVKQHFPYVAYNATRDARVRKEHFALESLGIDGTAIYNIDDPVFIMFRPPWSWNCRCSWHPVTVEQAARRGVKEAQEWWDRALELATKKNQTPYEVLDAVRPAKMQFVDQPPFEPDPAFHRIQTL